MLHIHGTKSPAYNKYSVNVEKRKNVEIVFVYGQPWGKGADGGRETFTDRTIKIKRINMNSPDGQIDGRTFQGEQHM